MTLEATTVVHPDIKPPNAPKERPILFSGPMVKAIIAGRKTQTRRIVKVHPAHAENAKLAHTDWDSGDGDARLQVVGGGGLWCKCPYGTKGDRLWVKETLRWSEDYKAAYFAADDGLAPVDEWPWQRSILPSIHMPRGVSRILLEIDSLRVERLQDITDDDAKAEGFPLPGPQTTKLTVRNLDGTVERSIAQGHFFDARSNFCATWEALNGKKAPWSSNPWVWVVSFHVVRPSSQRQSVDPK